MLGALDRARPWDLAKDPARRAELGTALNALLETLRLVARRKRDVERVYAMFPRLAERKGNGGGQLSGGEQQMLAIGRALLSDEAVDAVATLLK